MLDLYPWLEKFHNAWAFERLLRSPTALAKRMFGGVAAYDHGQLLLVLMESPGDKEYRGQKYNFDIWNGIFIPTDRERHAELLKIVPCAVSHPVLGKWLYLPEDSETFEDDVRKVLFLIASRSPLVGVVPKPRKSRRARRTRPSKAQPRRHR